MCSRGVSAGAVAERAASVEPTAAPRLLPCDQLVPGSTLELTEEMVDLGACVCVFVASLVPPPSFPSLSSSSCWQLSGLMTEARFRSSNTTRRMSADPQPTLITACARTQGAGGRWR
jgi:hypothetical protein